MYCSACGAPNNKQQNYCRQCGQELPALKQGRGIGSVLLLSVLSGVFGLFSAVSLYVTHLPEGGRWSVYLAAAFCLVIACYQATNIATLWKLRRRLNNLPRETLAPNVPAELSPVRHDSITEHTTRRLAATPVKDQSQRS